MSFVKEFTDFLKKYQVIGLAVAFIMGAAAGKLVSALVADIIMPIVGLMTPAGDWQQWAIELSPTSKMLVGHFLGSIIDFVIIAVVIFMIVKMIMKEDATQKR